MRFLHASSDSVREYVWSGSPPLQLLVWPAGVTHSCGVAQSVEYTYAGPLPLLFVNFIGVSVGAGVGAAPAGAPVGAVVAAAWQSRISHS